MCGGVMPQMPNAIVAVECEWTTPFTSGQVSKMPACHRYSFETLKSKLSSCSPFRFMSTTLSGAVSRNVTPVAVQR
jgi:hypothetical protein